MEKLKKCPFCGCENLRVMCFDGLEERYIYSEEELDEKEYYPYIHCCGCYIDFYADSSATLRETIKRWNRRCI